MTSMRSQQYKKCQRFMVIYHLKTEYDIEIEHKIIDRGNKVIDEIIDDLSFVILKDT